MSLFTPSPTDPFTGAALALAGVCALAMAIWPSPRRALPPMLAFLGGAALLALAADETLDLHERFGAWLWRRGVEAPGPITHVDDLVIALYVACGSVVALAAAPALKRHPGFLLRTLACGVPLVGAAALDVLGHPGSWTEIPEEGLELAGALAIAFVLWRELVRVPAWRATDVGLPTGSALASDFGTDSPR